MDLHLGKVSGSRQDLDDILHLLPLKANLEATGGVVAFVTEGEDLGMETTGLAEQMAISRSLLRMPFPFPNR